MTHRWAENWTVPVHCIKPVWRCFLPYITADLSLVCRLWCDGW